MAACNASGLSYIPVCNKLVTIQQPGGTRDAVGERSTTWTNLATAWAEIKPLTTRELLLAGQVQSEVSHRITLRYSASLAAVDASCRVTWASRVFVITGVRNLNEANRWLELTCSEGLREE